ncbi:MAG: alpha/beta hydrolase [bacterium]|nr:alpha/beta hydrolase [bacterium]
MTHTVTPLTTADGLTLHTAQYRPSTPPRAVIFLIHGYGEHHGRYRHVIDLLVGAGYAVCTLDHRGHGLSEGVRVHFESMAQPVQDLRAYVQAMRSQFSAEKRFVVGHSMGALISLLYTLEYQHELSGLVLSGIPLAATAAVSPAQLFITRVLKRIIPTAALIPSLPGSELAANPEVAAAFAADELTWKGKMRVSLGLSLTEGNQESRARLHQLTLPLLILHGADDKICPPAGSQWVFDQARSTDKTHHIYPGMKHEIFNETARALPLDEMIGWLNERTTA